MGALARITVPGLALLALAAAPSPGGPVAAAAEPAESTRRMAERLAALATQFERDERLNRTDFFNVNSPWKIPIYRSRLLQVEPAQSAVNVRFALARELLWDGQTEAALRELTGLNIALAGDGNGAV
ncbi:MAG: hypothetical protein V3U03_01080, partial [Myxococcota bacterium]